MQECTDYVKAGGTLRLPAIVFEQFAHFGEWCEVFVGPSDLPTAVNVSTVMTTYYKLTPVTSAHDYYIDPFGQILTVPDGFAVGGSRPPR